MPSKKSKRSQAQTLREYRARLKSMGLFGTRTDLRKRVTKAQQRKIAEYSDVLEGRAKVVAVPRKTARQFKGKFRVVQDKVVVPRAKGERVKFDPSRQEIVATRKAYGKKITRRAPANVTLPEQMPVAKNLSYSIDFNRGGNTERYRFDTMQDLENFMGRDSLRNFKNWIKYVEITELDDIDDSDVEEVRRIRKRRKKSKANKTGRGK